MLAIVKPSIETAVTVDEIRADSEEFIKALRSHVAISNPTCDTTVTIMGLDGGDNYRIHLEDDDTIITECSSEIAGETVRRLYFKSNHGVIQSEGFLRGGEFVTSKVGFGYHYVMASALALVGARDDGAHCIIGLGGGQLSSFYKVSE